LNHADIWHITPAAEPVCIPVDAAPQPGAVFHSARQVADMEWKAELDARGCEADLALWRERAADAFTLADAEDAEAAALVAVRPRKGAGLVSVSTTDTRTKRHSAETEEAAARKRRDERAQRARAGGLYVPGFDADGQRIRGLRRAVGFSARAHAVSEKGHRADECLMLTTTYHRGGDWRPEHVSGLLKVMREHCRRRGVALKYVWVAELQQRGAVHYHIALFVPRGFRFPMPDKNGWWPHGSTRIEVAKGAVGYLMKYLSKGTASNGNWRLPSGARMYGVGGLEHSLRRARRWLGLPAFVRSAGDHLDQWRPVVGGGWASPDGELFPSEYKRCRVGGVTGFEPVAHHARPSFLSVRGVRGVVAGAAQAEQLAAVQPDGPWSRVSRGGL